ncbi:hypothetical protein IWW48_006370, partial [Coemansia sp. RSA 1200]
PSNATRPSAAPRAGTAAAKNAPPIINKPGNNRMSYAATVGRKQRPPANPQAAEYALIPYDQNDKERSLYLDIPLFPSRVKNNRGAGAAADNAGMGTAPGNGETPGKPEPAGKAALERKNATPSADNAPPASAESKKAGKQADLPVAGTSAGPANCGDHNGDVSLLNICSVATHAYQSVCEIIQSQIGDSEPIPWAWRITKHPENDRDPGTLRISGTIRKMRTLRSLMATPIVL